MHQATVSKILEVDKYLVSECYLTYVHLTEDGRECEHYVIIAVFFGMKVQALCLTC